MRRSVAAAAAGGLLLSFGLTGGQAHAAPVVAKPLPAEQAQILSKSAKSVKLTPQLSAAKAGPKPVYVQLSGSGTAAASLSAQSAGRSKSG